MAGVVYKAPTNYECDTHTMSPTNETTEHIIAKYKPGYLNPWSIRYGLDYSGFQTRWL
jgi:hypothetical protein